MTIVHYFGCLDCIELTIPADMIASPGEDWDESAQHYAPILADLNRLSDELGECGGGWTREVREDWTDRELWGYVSWLVACVRLDEEMG